MWSLLVIIRRPEESGLDYESVLQVLEAVLEQKIEDNELKGTKKVAAVKIKQQNQKLLCQRLNRRIGKNMRQEVVPQVCAQKKRTISCIGIGMGTLDTLTHEAAETIRNADILFGAKRILESVEHMPDLLRDDQERVEEYRSAQIAEYLSTRPHLYPDCDSDVRRCRILQRGTSCAGCVPG